MQPPAIPITIRKTLVGQFIIWFFGLSAVGILLGAAMGLQPSNPTLSSLLGAGAFTAILVTLIASYVYGLSRITITAEQLDVVNWNSIVSQNNAVCEWRQVQDVDFKKSGILGLTFDFGTLLVQTAGTERNLKITYVPRVEWARNLIAEYAENAVTPVKEQ